jgi:hypothetical protein
MSALFFFIPPPFLSVGPSRRDDPNDLYRLPGFRFFPDGMGHQEEEMAFDESQSLPSLFTGFDTVLIGERERVAERSDRDLETDAVL